MHEQQHWHPVARTDEVGDTPLAVALLGQRLVLWRDGAGALHAFADRCPHAQPSCLQQQPALRATRPGQQVACLLAGITEEAA